MLIKLYRTRLIPPQLCRQKRWLTTPTSLLKPPWRSGRPRSSVEASVGGGSLLSPGPGLSELLSSLSHNECRGCGALLQFTEEDKEGFVDLQGRRNRETATHKTHLQLVDPQIIEDLQLSNESVKHRGGLCRRCEDLAQGKLEEVGKVKVQVERKSKYIMLKKWKGIISLLISLNRCTKEHS